MYVCMLEKLIYIMRTREAIRFNDFLKKLIMVKWKSSWSYLGYKLNQASLVKDKQQN